MVGIELSFADYKKAHYEIQKAVEENRQAFEMAVLLHEQGISTEKTRENVTKASVLAWVLERFKQYPIDVPKNAPVGDIEAKNI